jgi:pSer/pThr/pTyr-binding forkhead associated (FHA) protein
MDLKLRVLEGKNAGREIPVPNNKFLIGRAEDCHLRPGSDLISRHHCVLLVEEGYIGVRDFGSKNGTYVNDERVSGERELKAGDRLAIGPLKFEIHVAHGLAAKKRPPVADVKEAAARTAQDAQQDPFDVNSWLDSAADSETAAVKDTNGVHASDTETIDVSTTQTFTPEAPPEEEEDKPAHVKKTPGKLPQIPQSTKDSQSAAANALNKFRKRR